MPFLRNRRCGFDSCHKDLKNEKGVGDLTLLPLIFICHKDQSELLKRYAYTLTLKITTSFWESQGLFYGLKLASLAIDSGSLTLRMNSESALASSLSKTGSRSKLIMPPIAPNKEAMLTLFDRLS